VHFRLKWKEKLTVLNPFSRRDYYYVMEMFNQIISAAYHDEWALVNRIILTYTQMLQLDGIDYNCEI
jgi:hypothetical protein